MTESSRLWQDVPIFGTEEPAITYRLRLGAYAVMIRDGAVAVVNTPEGRFLPGGGLESGESAEDALRREVEEECGFTCTPARLLGEAVEYVYSVKEREHLRKHGHYFLAEPGELLPSKKELDHELEWIPAPDAAVLLAHASQAWVVRRFTDGTD